MTDKKIIKVLECCAYSEGCEKCPCSKQCDGAEHLINALDLINRLQAKNKELRKIAEYQQKVTMERGFEIKRLKIKREALEATARVAGKATRDDAVKMFAKKLKQGLPTWLHPYIDVVEREMKGEE